MCDPIRPAKSWRQILFDPSAVFGFMIAPAAVGLSAVVPHALLMHGEMFLLASSMIAAFGASAVPGWTAGPVIHLVLAKRGHSKVWQYLLAGILLGLMALAA